MIPKALISDISSSSSTINLIIIITILLECSYASKAIGRQVHSYIFYWLVLTAHAHAKEERRGGERERERGREGE